MQGAVREIFWMAFASQQRDLGDWQACLADMPPEKPSPTAWYYWAIEKAIFDAVLADDPGRLRTIIESYEQACSHARGLVPIALMSVTFILIWTRREGVLDAEFPFGERITRLLRALPEGNDIPTISDWLLETKDWVVGALKNVDWKIGDLLTTFIAQIERLAEEGVLERDGTYERAIDFAKALQECREALTVSGSSA